MIANKCGCMTVMNFGLNSTEPIMKFISCDLHSGRTVISVRDDDSNY
jgi:hypothetical protein